MNVGQFYQCRLNQLGAFSLLDTGIEPGLRLAGQGGNLAPGSSALASRPIDGSAMNGGKNKCGCGWRGDVLTLSCLQPRFLNQILRVSLRARLLPRKE